MFRLIARYNVIWLLLILMLLPGLIWVDMILLGEKHVFKWTKSNYRLTGMTSSLKPPKQMDLKHFKNHEVQKYIEQKLSESLPLRSWFIRLSNQLYYSIFKTSYAYYNNIVIGKNNTLFEKIYITSYCGLIEPLNYSQKQLVDWANKLKELSDFFEKNGKTFIYLITPNKAEYMPEAIPKRYHCHVRGPSPHLKLFTQLLDERKINYVNAVDLIFTATQQFNTSMFVKGGTHWNTLGVALTVQSLIDMANRKSRFSLNQVAFDYSIVNKANGIDHDLLSLLNLIKPNKQYPVPKVNFKKNKFSEKYAVTTSLIGGSFFEMINQVFISNNIFSHLRFYRYFKLAELDYHAGKINITYDLDQSLDKVIQNIVHSDIIILEENSLMTRSNHGLLFYNTMKKYSPLDLSGES